MIFYVKEVKSLRERQIFGKSLLGKDKLKVEKEKL